MEQRFCQSCGMPLNDSSSRGTNQDDTLNGDFCKYCFQKGHFTKDCSMEEMIDSCAQYINQFNSHSPVKLTKEEAIRQMKMEFPSLKRWKKEQTNRVHNEAVNKAIDYIDQHLYEAVDMKTLAELTCISTYHFHRLFKSIVGESIGEYIQRIRLEKIAHQLKVSSIPISELVEQTHYNNKYALSKAFKKHFGVSPSVYRLNSETYSAVNHRDQYIPLTLYPMIKEMEEFNIVYLSINQTQRTDQGYFKAWDELKEFVKEQHLNETGLFLSFSFDNFKITEANKCRYYIGHTLEHSIKPVGKYGVKKIDGGLFAIFRCNGTFAQLENIYANIYNHWLLNCNYVLRDTHSFEIYIHNPNDFEENDLITDIYIPVKTK